MSQTLPANRTRRRSTWPLPTLADLLWAALGLELTLAGTLVRLDLPNSVPQQLNWPLSWVWEPAYSFSLQVAAVLLTAVIGGPWAGLLAQIAYVGLGLWHYPVFYEGGGLDYLTHPSFGYLFGFLPGAWLAGSLAFNQRSSLNHLAKSCLMGLGCIHLCGLIGLVAHFKWGWALLEGIWMLAFLPLLGQLIGVLMVAVIGLGIRRVFFT
jgi:biotin transport system substrate-specific component